MIPAKHRSGEARRPGKGAAAERRRLYWRVGILLAGAGAAILVLRVILWTVNRPSPDPWPVPRLSTGQDHHVAGRHDAAAEEYLRALEKPGDPHPKHTLHRDLLRCRLESIRALERAGRASESAALCEETLHLLGQAYGLQASFISSELILRTAMGRMDRFEHESAFKLLERSRGRLFGTAYEWGLPLQPWEEIRGTMETAPPRKVFMAALEAITPALTDPDDPAHEGAARILAVLLLDPDYSTTTGEWLADRWPVAAAALPSLLTGIDDLVDEICFQDAYEFALGMLVGGLGRLRAQSPGTALEEALAKFARDGDHPPPARGAALDLLIGIADLPFEPGFHYQVGAWRRLPPAAEEALTLWEEVRGGRRSRDVSRCSLAGREAAG